MLSYWVNSDGEIQISYDIVYMWNLEKNGTNELCFLQNRNRDTDVENKLWRGGVEGKIGRLRLI